MLNKIIVEESLTKISDLQMKKVGNFILQNDTNETKFLCLSSNIIIFEVGE